VAESERREGLERRGEGVVEGPPDEVSSASPSIAFCCSSDLHGIKAQGLLCSTLTRSRQVHWHVAI